MLDSLYLLKCSCRYFWTTGLAFQGVCFSSLSLCFSLSVPPLVDEGCYQEGTQSPMGHPGDSLGLEKEHQ